MKDRFRCRLPCRPRILWVVSIDARGSDPSRQRFTGPNSPRRHAGILLRLMGHRSPGNTARAGLETEIKSPDGSKLVCVHTNLCSAYKFVHCEIRAARLISPCRHHPPPLMSAQIRKARWTSSPGGLFILALAQAGSAAHVSRRCRNSISGKPARSCGDCLSAVLRVETRFAHNTVIITIQQRIASAAATGTPQSANSRDGYLGSRWIRDIV